jgi:ABC-type polysaccharide/polyol phosphate transport system ATPase subunit
MNVIEVRGVSKKFNRHPTRKLLRDHFRDRLKRPESPRVFYALRNVSFDVGRAEGIQIIGANGAGKSTLLSLISGLTTPDAGSIRVNGQVRALLELGSGFHPDLTGLENLTLNAALIGITEAQVRRATSKIIEFAELEDCIEEPLRTFSAGMIMRLAFSVAISVRPDVLIVDEVLGVGDAGFQRKCFQAVRKLREQGTALLCVSHIAGIGEEFCSRAIWLNAGEVLADGEYRATVSRYRESLNSGDVEEHQRALAHPGSGDK